MVLALLAFSVACGSDSTPDGQSVLASPFAPSTASPTPSTDALPVPGQAEGIRRGEDCILGVRKASELPTVLTCTLYNVPLDWDILRATCWTDDTGLTSVQSHCRTEDTSKIHLQRTGTTVTLTRRLNEFDCGTSQDDVHGRPRPDQILWHLVIQMDPCKPPSGECLTDIIPTTGGWSVNGGQATATFLAMKPVHGLWLVSLRFGPNAVHEPGKAGVPQFAIHKKPNPSDKSGSLTLTAPVDETGQFDLWCGPEPPDVLTAADMADFERGILAYGYRGSLDEPWRFRRFSTGEALFVAASE